MLDVIYHFFACFIALASRSFFGHFLFARLLFGLEFGNLDPGIHIGNMLKQSAWPAWFKTRLQTPAASLLKLAVKSVPFSVQIASGSLRCIAQTHTRCATQKSLLLNHAARPASNVPQL